LGKTRAIQNALKLFSTKRNHTIHEENNSSCKSQVLEVSYSPCNEAGNISPCEAGNPTVTSLTKRDGILETSLLSSVIIHEAPYGSDLFNGKRVIPNHLDLILRNMEHHVELSAFHMNIQSLNAEYRDL
jgi:hypothetical protein